MHIRQYWREQRDAWNASRLEAALEVICIYLERLPLIGGMLCQAISLIYSSVIYCYNLEFSIDLQLNCYDAQRPQRTQQLKLMLFKLLTGLSEKRVNRFARLLNYLGIRQNYLRGDMQIRWDIFYQELASLNLISKELRKVSRKQLQLYTHGMLLPRRTTLVVRWLMKKNLR